MYIPNRCLKLDLHDLCPTQVSYVQLKNHASASK